LARHRRPLEDDESDTDILAEIVEEVEDDDGFILIEEDKPVMSGLPGGVIETGPMKVTVSPPDPDPSNPNRPPRKEAAGSSKHHYEPMFRGFSRTEPLAAQRDPKPKPRPKPQPSRTQRVRSSLILITLLAVALSILSFGLMFSMWLNRPTCPKPPPLHPPITIRMTPTPEERR
jgi:hypothetical protein